MKQVSTEGSHVFANFRKSRWYPLFLLPLFLLGSTVFTMSNKWMFSILRFNAPLFMTMTHMLAGFFGTAGLAASKAVFGVGYIPSKLQTQGSWFYFLLFSAIFAAKLCLANLSLGYLTIPDQQVVQSTTPLATFIAASFVEKRQVSMVESGCLLGITGGALMVLATTPTFHLIGVLTGFGSVLMAALSLNLTAIFRKHLSLNALDMSFYTSIPCTLFIVPFIFLTGEHKVLLAQFEQHPASFVLSLITFSASLAFLYNIIRNELCQSSSSVFTSSASNFKTVITIICSEIFLQPSGMGLVQTAGLVVVCLAFFVLSYLQSVENKPQETKKKD